MNIRIYESAMTWKPFAHDNPQRLGFAEKNTHDVWGACHIVTSSCRSLESIETLEKLELSHYYFADVRVTRGRGRHEDPHYEKRMECVRCFYVRTGDVLRAGCAGRCGELWCHYPWTLDGMTASNSWVYISLGYLVSLFSLLWSPVWILIFVHIILIMFPYMFITRIPVL